MWKKLISLNLVLLLLLTLLPLGAAAESAGLKDDWGETTLFTSECFLLYPCYFAYKS